MEDRGGTSASDALMFSFGIHQKGINSEYLTLREVVRNNVKTMDFCDATIIWNYTGVIAYVGVRA